jgi:tRNA C32,U32 (ribose-2'-O)-methylase TrmJ
MIQIPTSDNFSSLNLAAAVQVVTYELRCYVDELQQKPLLPPDEVPVSAEEMRLFYEHLEQTLIDIHFLDPEKPRRLMRRLQRLFNRAQPVTSEMNLLRGILTTAQNIHKKL